MTQDQLVQSRITLKRKLRAREKVFAGWTSFGHPSLTEIIASAGVEFIGIDLEHSTISQHENQRIIASAQGLGALALPRLASHNREMVKRVLDSGADGLIVPLVSSRAQAEEMASWGLYPPQGVRNFGVARAQGYGFDYDAYTKHWNKGFIFIVQIETKEGVEQIDDILAVKAIDGVMVGPYDLSGSYGVPGQLRHPLVQKACGRIVASCRRAGKACGTQIVDPDSQSTGKALRAGFNFVILDSDLFALWKWGERMRSIIQEKA